MISILRRLIGEESPLDQLEKRIGRRFKKRSLLIEALTHSSYAREHRDVPDNERFEFLGDAVLQLVATEHVYKKPTDSEGDMSKARAALVSADGLLRIAERLDLSEHILLGKGEKKSGGGRKKKVLEDCVESIVGALYLDGGMRAARKFLLPHWGVLDFTARTDHKTHAQEVFQRERGATPGYRVIETFGPAHARSFRVEIIVAGKVVGQGEGSSIKSAEQAAAKESLEMKFVSPEKEPTRPRPSQA